MKTVRDLLKKGAGINLMTPFGYVNLPVGTVKELADVVATNKPVTIFRHADSSDTNAKLDEEEIEMLLNFKLFEGGYNHKTNTYDYLADLEE